MPDGGGFHPHRCPIFCLHEDRVVAAAGVPARRFNLPVSVPTSVLSVTGGRRVGRSGVVMLGKQTTSALPNGKRKGAAALGPEWCRRGQSSDTRFVAHRNGSPPGGLPGGPSIAVWVTAN